MKHSSEVEARSPGASEGAEPSDDAEAAVEEAQRTRPYQRYLQAGLGLRDHWYPAFFSHELSDGGTRSETLLGERIFFKRAQGRVYAIEDRCPHRGVAFSARPECYSTNTVTCWFHGFTFDVRDGKLVQVLTEPGCSLVGKVSVKAYPIEERSGVVFIFIGDLAPPPPLTDDVPPRLLTPGMVFRPLTRHKLRGNWRLATEQGFDAAHIYGHRDAELLKRLGFALPLGTYSSRKSLATLEEGAGPKGIRKRDDRSVWVAEVEGVRIHPPNVDPDLPPPPLDLDALEVGMYLPCALQVVNFPVPSMYHFEWYVPVDEDHHLYMIMQATLAETPEQEQRFQEDCEKLYGPLVWTPPGVKPEGFTNFDEFIREQMAHAYGREDWWSRERLFRPDNIIVQWRMLVARHMRGIQRRGDWARKDDGSP
jgi:carbazole 1,9a-dioxygenase terminal dioxygenase component